MGVIRAMNLYRMAARALVWSFEGHNPWGYCTFKGSICNTISKE